MLSQPKITLLGLPGCGISTLEPVLFDELKKIQQQGIEFPQNQAWTVINLAEKISCNDWVESYLSQCLIYSTAIVFTFVEQAGLDKQVAWQKWLKIRCDSLGLNNLPRLRFLNSSLPQNWQQRYLESNISPSKSLDINTLPALETFEFAISTLNLQHFFFSIDALRQNKGVNILRVSGSVQTTDYVAPVAIAVTALEMKTYPLKPKEIVTNQIKIQGVDLDYKVLQDVIKACLLG